LAACPLDLIRITNYIVLFKTKEAMNPHLRSKFPFPEIPETFDCVAKNESRYYYETIALD
jgi:hypothetical protein